MIRLAKEERICTVPIEKYTNFIPDMNIPNNALPFPAIITASTSEEYPFPIIVPATIAVAIAMPVTFPAFRDRFTKAETTPYLL